MRARWAHIAAAVSEPVPEDASRRVLPSAAGRARARGLREWLSFFLRGVAETATQAFTAATRIVQLFEEDRARITAESERAGSALRVHAGLQRHPFSTTAQLVVASGLSEPTVNAALADLMRLGMVEEVTGRRRGRVFGYRQYVAILGEGT